MTHDFELTRQKTLSQIASELSEIDNFRGKSQLLLNVIGKLSLAKSIHVYTLNNEQQKFQIVSSWYDDNIYMRNCTDYIHSVYCNEIPTELYNQLKTGDAIIDTNTLFPVTRSPWVRRSIIYGFSVQDQLIGIIIYDTDDIEGWDDMSVEWLNTIASMISSAIRRTVIYENLGKQLMWRDKVYPIIAHDLRGGMASIKMLSESMATLDSIEDLKEFSNMIAQTAEETFILLDNLLKWSRNNSVKVQPSKDNIDIINMINSIVSYFTNSVHSKNITLTFSSELNDYIIYIDKEMMHTIIRNLISNSLKFTPIGGSIEVGCREVGDKLEVWVQDNGVGMSEDKVNTLISGDKHLTTYGTEGEKGSGLGFSLVREFLAAHDSKIKIESEEGKGSKFSFII